MELGNLLQGLFIIQAHNKTSTNDFWVETIEDKKCVVTYTDVAMNNHDSSRMTNLGWAYSTNSENWSLKI